MDLALLDREIQTCCAREGFSGVIRVTEKDRVVYQQHIGFDHHGEKRPFTEDSMFTLYSMSKPFCAIGLLLLADKGLVDIDKHPGVYLPEAAGFDPRVTIRQMLQHVSGLPDFHCIPEFVGAPPKDHHTNIRRYLKQLTAYPQYFAPGQGDRYSNINFTISALMIENLTGMCYSDYMEKAVFAPMGAKTLVVDREGLEIPNRVQGYRVDDDGREEPTEKSYPWMLGGGDLVGRVEDVYCLNTVIKHRMLLKPETWEQVLTPHPLNNKGFGCTVTDWHGLRRVTHNGGHRGFRSFHVYVPETDLDLIILSNTGYGNARQPILEAVYRAFYDAGAAEEKPMELDYGLV